MTLSLCLQDIAQATGGEILAGEPTAPVPGISTDSRTITLGEWFLALRGENFDGHEFLAQVVGKGAAGLIVARDALLPELDAPVLAVDDTLKAYGDIANDWRMRMAPSVASIAGSNGKTTTKEICASVLSSRPEALYSLGNFNNLIGLPKTLLKIQPHHRIALVELGMNIRGELDRLTRIASPDVAALTNIGEAHVGMFGSIEALMDAKGELIRALRPGTRLLANADCPRSVEAVRKWGGHLKVKWFGVDSIAEFRAESIESQAPWGYVFELVHPGGRLTARLQAHGRHNVANALCAAALLHELGIPMEEIVAGIGRFQPANMRSAVETLSGVTLVEDCYNASPTAMRLAIESLTDLPHAHRVHLVLGDMLELGEAEEAYHRSIGEQVGALPNARLYAVGRRAGWYADAAVAAGMAPQSVGRFEDLHAVSDALLEAVEPGDAVLVKGSRMMKLENVVHALRDRLRETGE